MDCAIIIPARLSSTRLKNKPLIELQGVSVLLRTYKQALSANIGNIFIAGCDQGIEEFASYNNIQYIKTRKNLNSGTDRVYEAFEYLKSQYNYIINVQCDMPFINPRTIEAVYERLKNLKKDMCIVTAATPVNFPSTQKSDVKVIASSSGKVLYFTRHPIDMPQNYKHLGIYGFTPQSLKSFANAPVSSLEKHEKLEQLRALENNIDIEFINVQDPNISIDTEEDIQKALKFLEKDALLS